MIEAIPFQYTDNITVINREQFDAHMRLYTGYVNNINKVDEELSSTEEREQSNSTFSYYREMKRGETFALNGVILHELYFQNIMGGATRPSRRAMASIAMYFGSMDNWQEDYIATAKASRGWAILSYDQRSNRLRNISLDAHDMGSIVYSAPILVLDMYEHAYFLQYADKKTDYIQEFMRSINWEAVDKRLSYCS